MNRSILSFGNYEYKKEGLDQNWLNSVNLLSSQWIVLEIVDLKEWENPDIFNRKTSWPDQMYKWKLFLDLTRLHIKKICCHHCYSWKPLWGLGERFRIPEIFQIFKVCHFIENDFLQRFCYSITCPAQTGSLWIWATSLNRRQGQNLETIFVRTRFEPAIQMVIWMNYDFFQIYIVNGQHHLFPRIRSFNIVSCFIQIFFDLLKEDHIMFSYLTGNLKGSKFESWLPVHSLEPGQIIQVLKLPININADFLCFGHWKKRSRFFSMTPPWLLLARNQFKIDCNPWNTIGFSDCEIRIQQKQPFFLLSIFLPSKITNKRVVILVRQHFFY